MKTKPKPKKATGKPAKTRPAGAKPAPPPDRPKPPVLVLPEHFEHGYPLPPELENHPSFKHRTVTVRTGHEPVLTGEGSYGPVNAEMLWNPLTLALERLPQLAGDALENGRDAENILYPLLCVAELAKVLHYLGSGEVKPPDGFSLPVIGPLS